MSDDIARAIEWLLGVQQYWEWLLPMGLLLLTLLRAVAHLTPWRKDMQWVDKAEQFIQTLFNILRHRPIKTAATFDANTPTGKPKRN